MANKRLPMRKIKEVLRLKYTCGLGERERLELLGTAAARLLEPIQAYGLTREEIEQHSLTPFWSDILEHEAVSVYG